MVFAVKTSPMNEFNFSECHSNYKIVNVSGHAMATAMTRQDIIERHDVDGDAEVAAHVQYLLPDQERNGNESISPAEAFANAKWTTKDDGTGIILDSIAFATAGSRWPFDDDKFKKTYAESSASTELALDITLANRDDTTKQLFLTLAIDLRDQQEGVCCGYFSIPRGRCPCISERQHAQHTNYLERRRH